MIVRWWDSNQFDLRTLATHGFGGVVDGWVTTITTAMTDERSHAEPLDHKLVPHLVPDYPGAVVGRRSPMPDYERRKTDLITVGASLWLG